MQWLTKKTITKTYLMAILVVGMTVSALPQFILAIALLSINLYATYKQLTPKNNIPLILGTIILAPLTLTQLMGSLTPCLFLLPALYLLDQELREYAVTQPLEPKNRTREPTRLLTSTLIALVAIFATSISIENVTMVSTTAFLIAYFAIFSLLSIIKVPKQPIHGARTWSRILVGATEKKTIQITSLTKWPLYLVITSLQPWVRVKQSVYLLKSKKKIDVEVTYTPPLAGPAKILLQALTLDTRGLIQITQQLELIELHVLPRAKYAQWLAKKFLEHSGVGASPTAASLHHKAVRLARKSVEYYGNRPYQPGDRLREIDWKHTYMLSELVVKDFQGTHKQPTFIVANLEAGSVEKADRLAFNIMVSALTSAVEALPSGTVFFNREAVIAATGLADSRETVKKSLKYTGLIKVSPQPIRVLQPEQLGEKPTGTQTKDELKKVVEFETSINQTITKTYPGSQALNKCIEKTSMPSTIIVASSLTDEEKALLVTLQKLRGKGHSIIKVDA